MQSEIIIIIILRMRSNNVQTNTVQHLVGKVSKSKAVLLLTPLISGVHTS